MAEQDSAPGNGWGHHNLKTTADVERMLKGLPPQIAPAASSLATQAAETEQEGEAIPPAPATITTDEVTLQHDDQTKSSDNVARTSSDPLATERRLEAETGHDVVKTGDDPPTYVETDEPEPKRSHSRKVN